jgi:hypothetical protein
MTTAPALRADRDVMRPVRRPNAEYRVREHLTEAEIAKLLAVLKGNRHGSRDWLIGLMIYRHGLRVSEACDLRWDDIDLVARTIVIRRLKGSRDSTHYLERDELTGCADLHARALTSLSTSAASRSVVWALPGSSNALAKPQGAHAPPFLRSCVSEQGDGYAEASTLPRPCQYHEHGPVFGDEPGAV